jgi:hypothetical protein
MLNMKDINKILAKIESYVWGKNCNIWTSLIPGTFHEKHKFKYLKNLMVKVWTAKKGGCPEDHLGIKNRIKKIPVH